MSKMPRPIFKIYSGYESGHNFLGIQYLDIRRLKAVAWDLSPVLLHNVQDVLSNVQSTFTYKIKMDTLLRNTVSAVLTNFIEPTKFTPIRQNCCFSQRKYRSHVFVPRMPYPDQNTSKMHNFLLLYNWNSELGTQRRLVPFS